MFFSGMEENEDYQVREATEPDKEAVLQIRENVYGGRDYLPDYYDFFVAAPNVTPFVLLDKEKIVRISFVLYTTNNQMYVLFIRNECEII